MLAATGLRGAGLGHAARRRQLRVREPRARVPTSGFVASFSQWFSLSVAIGVVSYLIVPFLRDIAVALGWTAAAASLETGRVRLAISLALLWAAAGRQPAAASRSTSD